MSIGTFALGGLTVLAMVVASLQSASAHPYEGETIVETGRGIPDADGNIVRLQSMTIRWRFDVFMNEPLRQFAGRYSHYSPPWVELARVQSCFMGKEIQAFRPVKVEPHMVSDGVLDRVEIYSTTRLRMIIEPHVALNFALGSANVIQHEFTVDTFSQDESYGPSISGSPSWDRLFQVGEVGSENNPWLTEAQARELFSVGFSVARIEMIEPRYALSLVRASYDRHFPERGCGSDTQQAASSDDDEEQDATEENEGTPAESQPPAPAEQTAEDRLNAMLARVAAAQEQARQEQIQTAQDVTEHAEDSAADDLNSAAESQESAAPKIEVATYQSDNWVFIDGVRVSGPYRRQRYYDNTHVTAVGIFAEKYYVESETNYGPRRSNSLRDLHNVKSNFYDIHTGNLVKTVEGYAYVSHVGFIFIDGRSSFRVEKVYTTQEFETYTYNCDRYLLDSDLNEVRNPQTIEQHKVFVASAGCRN